MSDELTEDDFVAPNLIKENLGDRENPEQILDFIMSEEGGGGMPKCYSLSYIQGVFAYNELKKDTK